MWMRHVGLVCWLSFITGYPTIQHVLGIDMLNKDVNIELLLKNVMALWTLMTTHSMLIWIVQVGMSVAHVWEPIHEQILVVCHTAQF